MAADRKTAVIRLSQRLLALEAAASGRAVDSPVAAFRISDRLRPSLTRLMGTSGFRSLLTRAVAVAGKEVAWLRDMKIEPDGSVQDQEAPTPKVPPAALTAGGVALTAEFLGLLVTFIGRELTVRLLRDAWPQFDDVGL